MDVTLCGKVFLDLIEVDQMSLLQEIIDVLHVNCCKASLASNMFCVWIVGESKRAMQLEGVVDKSLADSENCTDFFHFQVLFMEKDRYACFEVSRYWTTRHGGGTKARWTILIASGYRALALWHVWYTEEERTESLGLGKPGTKEDQSACISWFFFFFF